MIMIIINVRLRTRCQQNSETKRNNTVRYAFKCEEVKRSKFGRGRPAVYRDRMAEKFAAKWVNETLDRPFTTDFIVVWIGEGCLSIQ